MDSPFHLIKCAIQRLISGRVSIGLWLLLVAGSFMPLALDHFMTAIDGTSASKIVSDASVLLLTIFAFAVILLGFWKLKRAAANYQDRTGNFFAWVGWGILAYSPMFVGAFIIYRVEPDGEPFYLETVYAVGVAFFAPLLVHASGRAIDQYGPPLASISNHWSPRYLSLIIAYLVATVPLYIASDIVLHFSEDGRDALLIGDIVSVLLFLAGSTIATAVTVEAFHRAERAEIEAT